MKTPLYRNLKIIQFDDGRYGIRQERFAGYYFYDNLTNRFIYPRNGIVPSYCKYSDLNSVKQDFRKFDCGTEINLED